MTPRAPLWKSLLYCTPGWLFVPLLAYGRDWPNVIGAGITTLLLCIILLLWTRYAARKEGLL